MSFASALCLQNVARVAAASAGYPVDAIIDFETGSADDMITAANLAAGTHGATLTWVFEDDGEDPVADLTHTRLSAVGYTRRVALVCNGAGYAAASKGCYSDMTGRSGATGFELARGTFAATHANLAVTWQQKFATGGTSCALVPMSLELASGTGWSATVLQKTINDTGHSQGNVVAHGQVSGESTYSAVGIPVDDLTTYSCTNRRKAAVAISETIVLNAATGAFVGYVSCATDTGQANSIRVPTDYLNSNGGRIDWGLIGIDWTHAAFPMEPVTIPPATSVSAAQTGSDPSAAVTVSFTAPATVDVLIERSVDGGAYSTLDQRGYTAGAKTYVDSDVADDSTYTYKVTCKAGAENSSTTVTSNAVTVEAPAGFDPATDSSTIQWFKADAIVGLNNGDQIESWPKSKGLDGAIRDSSHHSKWLTNQQNSLPAVDMDGVNTYSYFQTSAFGVHAQPYRLWIVFKLTATNANQAVFDSQSTTGFGYLRVNGTTGHWEINAGAALDCGAADTNWHIIECVFRDTSSSFRKDHGTAVTGSAGTQAFGSASNGMRLGNGTQAGAYGPGNCIVGEFLFQTDLTATEEDIWTYLNARWATYTP